MNPKVIGLLCVGLLVILSAVWLAGRKILSIEPMAATSGTATLTEGQEGSAEVRQRLLEVGLHPTGILSDLGVDDHLVRLEKGEVSASVLIAYADAIEALTNQSTKRGQALPPTLWDVSTPALLDAGWTVYSLTTALASEAGRVHVDLLTDAYSAFLENRPDALQGALALLPLAGSYVRALPEEARAEHEVHAKTDGEATLLIWQALLTGTTRHNPITHRPLWSHGFVGHFSVPHIHQYATGTGLTPSQVWGVEGFSPTFVGTAANSNQVEHLGISALLQGVASVPGAVLSAVESIEVAVDGEDDAAAAADKALNAVVRDILVPRKEEDPHKLAAALHTALAAQPD
ncbi:hypothetical protein D1823_11535 [Ruegeria sp. AD91A]|uniref:hypothetical protein n=1 Tax=Ruegeria sp. AD91A TaxID=2293862 RepID=UPI000E4B2178|nr:hypothetical protein [Ruegeria sp. AD91A]AXT27154.1 hypothetical protein D1823_11535 [Ruegeria sp. AD91A]